MNTFAIPEQRLEQLLVHLAELAEEDSSQELSRVIVLTDLIPAFSTPLGGSSSTVRCPKCKRQLTVS